VEFRMGRVEPCGQMPPRDEVDAAYPRRETLHAAEPVSQRAPVAVADFRGVFVACVPVLVSVSALALVSAFASVPAVAPVRGAACGGECLPPAGVVAVDPRDDEVGRRYGFTLHNPVL